MSEFLPFANDSQSVGLTSKAGEITLENQGQQVNLYGNATFTLDKDSLELAKQLQQAITGIVTYLEQHNATDIPHEQVKSAEATKVTDVSNPFAS